MTSTNSSHFLLSCARFWKLFRSFIDVNCFIDNVGFVLRANFISLWIDVGSVVLIVP